jgi:hypothetical protein
MRNTLLAILVTVQPAAIAAAEQPGLPKPDKSATSSKLLPLKGARAVNSCAAYGAGFVKVEGTDTCVKIGGGISIESGSSSGSR